MVTQLRIEHAPMTQEYKHNMVLRVSQVFLLFVILLV
jgi:hypothetical protein